MRPSRFILGSDGGYRRDVPRSAPLIWLVGLSLLLDGCVLDAPVARFGDAGLGPVIYVSASSGDDARSGLAPEGAVRTLGRALAVLDQVGAVELRLLRGDRWRESLGRWARSGTASQPLRIGAYGDATARPVIEAAPVLFTAPEDAPRFLEVVGIELVAADRDPAIAGFASTGPPLIDWRGGGSDVRFEDCLFRWEGFYVRNEGPALERLTFERCLFLDAYDASERSHGLHLDGAEDVLVEACVFDHNGWHASVPNAEPDIVSHNMYVENGGEGRVRVVDSIFVRGASHGVQMRSGGELIGNVLMRNAISILIGGGDHPSAEGVDGIVADNLILDGSDIMPRPERAGGDVPRGWGIDIDNVRDVTVRGNLLARCLGGLCQSIRDVPGVSYADNIIYQWPSVASGYLPETDATFTSPDRTIATYQETLGREPSFDAFVAALRVQHGERWDPAYAAPAIRVYFREGFTQP